MKRFSRSHLSSDFSEYKFLRNKARALLCAAKKNYFLQKFSHYSDSASVWKTVHEITGNRKQKSHITELVSAENGKPLDICDALATDFIVKPTEDSSGDLSLPPVPESPIFSWVTPQSIQTALGLEKKGEPDKSGLTHFLIHDPTPFYVNFIFFSVPVYS